MADFSMSLKAGQFNPVAFTPSQYQFQPTDMSFLERSLAKREARIQQATEQQTAIDQALGAIELKLNPKEADWFNTYKQNIKNQIQEQIDAGDYGNAIRTATRLAGKVASDSDVLGRIESQQNFLDALKTNRARVDKGEVDATAFKMWEANAYNASENYTKGNVWTPTPLYNRFDLANEALLNAKLIIPNRISTDTNNINTGLRSQNTIEQVTEDQIIANLRTRYNTNEQLRGQIAQDLAVQRFKLAELQNELTNNSNLSTEEQQNIRNQIDDIKGNTERNGQLLTDKEYYEHMIMNSDIIKNLAYIHSSSSNIYTPATIGNPHRNNVGSGILRVDIDSEQTPGTPIEQSTEILGEINSLSQDVTNRFNSNVYHNQN